MLITINGFTFNLTAQIFGIFVLFFLTSAYITKKRARYLALMIGVYIFSIFESSVLGAYSDIIVNGVCLIRNAIILILLRRGKEMGRWVALLFVALMDISCIPFISVWYDILPPLLVTVYTFFTIQPNILATKFCGLFVEGTVCLYCYLIGAYIGCLRQVIAVAAIIIGIIIYIREIKSRKAVS